MSRNLAGIVDTGSATFAGVNTSGNACIAGVFDTGKAALEYLTICQNLYLDNQQKKAINRYYFPMTSIQYSKEPSSYNITLCCTGFVDIGNAQKNRVSP
jgi:hypothetical protein